MWLIQTSFLCDERNLRTFPAGEHANRAQWPTRNSKRTVHNFPENQIVTFLWRIGNQEQARTVADHFTSSKMTTRRHLVALVEAKFTIMGTRARSYRVEMPNGTGNFRNFQIPRKKQNNKNNKNNNLEMLIEIFETNFRKRSVPFDFEREFPEISVEWNALIKF